MTNEEFGTKLLSEIQGIEPFGPVAAAIRRVLGIDEPKSPPTESQPVQIFVPPEFPQIRVKYDKYGNELARTRVISSLDDLSVLAREGSVISDDDRGVRTHENSNIYAWSPVPLVTGKE